MKKGILIIVGIIVFFTSTFSAKAYSNMSVKEFIDGFESFVNNYDYGEDEGGIFIEIYTSEYKDNIWKLTLVDNRDYNYEMSLKNENGVLNFISANSAFISYYLMDYIKYVSPEFDSSKNYDIEKELINTEGFYLDLNTMNGEDIVEDIKIDLSSLFLNKIVESEEKDDMVFKKPKQELNSIILCCVLSAIVILIMLLKFIKKKI